MKKTGMALVLIFVVFFSLLQGCENDNSPYPSGGRDIHDEFGNRRFVMLRGLVGGEVEDRIGWTLYDRKEPGAVADDVYNYKESGNYVYCIGVTGYTKLNFVTGELVQTKSFSEFSEKDQKIFEKLEETKDKVKIK